MVAASTPSSPAGKNPQQAPFFRYSDTCAYNYWSSYRTRRKIPPLPLNFFSFSDNLLSMLSSLSSISSKMLLQRPIAGSQVTLNWEKVQVYISPLYSSFFCAFPIVLWIIIIQRKSFSCF